MNPNFFYDVGFVNPSGAAAYEYSRLDPDNKVDYSGLFHESMMDLGMLNAEGLEYVNKYRDIPSPHKYPSPGLEIDCGNGVPACFCPLAENGMGSQAVLDYFADVLGCAHVPMPTVPFPLTINEVGIFPGRGANLFRFLIRGPHAAQADFADSKGCVNTSIMRTSQQPVAGQSGTSFDWDGENMTNFTFYSPNIYEHDRWVNDRRIDATARIAKLYEGRKYNLKEHVKISLNPAVDPNYMKVYFSVFESIGGKSLF